MERTVWQVLNGLADDVHGLAHFLLSHGKPVVSIAAGAYRNDKIEILVRAIWRGNTHVIINTCGAQVRTCEAVLQCAFSIDSSATYRAVHEDPIAFE